MGEIIGKLLVFIPVLVAIVVLAVSCVPQFGQLTLRLGAETVTIVDLSTSGATSPDGTRDLKIITILGRDGILAILDPVFGNSATAGDQMELNERVIGVSINGESHAYPLSLISRHEIVNDTVGGKPIAVTWWALCFTGIVYAREIEGCRAG